MKKEKSLQTEVHPTGGLTSTCHFHAVRDQSVSVGSKLICQKLNHKGDRRKMINPPNSVLCSNKTLCSKHFHCLHNCDILVQNLRWKIQSDTQKGIQNVLGKKFSFLLLWKFSHTTRRVSFVGFKLCGEVKTPRFLFLMYKTAVYILQTSFHCLFIYFLLVVENWVGQ